LAVLVASATGREILGLGVVPLANMLPEVAYVKLGWALGLHPDDPEAVRHVMTTPIAGEMTPREPHDGYLVFQGGVPEIQEFLFISGKLGAWVFTDREGREFGERLPEAGAKIHVQFHTVESAGPGVEDPSEEAVLFSLDGVPDHIDGEWLRRHQHLLEWSRDGKRLRVKRPRSRRSA
jgi:hypothetical protein